LYLLAEQCAAAQWQYPNKSLNLEVTMAHSHCELCEQSPEFLSTPNKASDRPSFRITTWLKHCWKTLIDVMAGSYEPKVWHKCDRQGRIVAWYVYDPEMGRSTSFGSELEVRLWLEQRYYR
jgi:hypothetical protein